MNINISNIRVKERVRKEVTKISELAADITINGLLNPVTVMATNDGSSEEYQLLAGLRRLRAAQSLGWSEIPVNVVAPADAEHALRIEFAENEQREAFTFSEKVDYGRLIEEIERIKSRERKVEGGTAFGRGRPKDEKVTDQGPYPIETEKRETRSIVGEKVGMSGKQYDRAKYIANNAPPEIIDELDRGERTIRGTYDELRAKEKSDESAAPESPPRREHSAEVPTAAYTERTSAEPQAPAAFAPRSPKPPKLSEREKEERAMAMFTPKEREAIERNNAFAAMSPEEKIADLQRQLKEERTRSVTAESELSRLRDELHNAVYHRDGIIKSLERQLVSAHAKIRELEDNTNVTAD